MTGSAKKVTERERILKAMQTPPAEGGPSGLGSGSRLPSGLTAMYGRPARLQSACRNPESKTANPFGLAVLLESGGGDGRSRTADLWVMKPKKSTLSQIDRGCMQDILSI